MSKKNKIKKAPKTPKLDKLKNPVLMTVPDSKTLSGWNLYLKKELQLFIKEEFDEMGSFRLSEEDLNEIARMEEFDIYPEDWYVYYFVHQEADNLFSISCEFDMEDDDDLELLVTFKNNLCFLLLDRIEESRCDEC